VAVEQGIPVSREVLEATLDAAGTKAAQERAGTRHHALWIIRKGSVADHGVVRVGVHVHHRREVQGDAQASELPAQHAAHPFEQAEIAEIREPAHGRQAQRGRSEPCHSSALLVDGDQRGKIGGGPASDARAQFLKLGERRGQLPQIAPKQNHAGALSSAQRRR
jgi:hypothetical protein